MRHHRILTIAGATVLLGLTGVAGSAVTQAAPQHTVKMITLGRYQTGTVNVPASTLAAKAVRHAASAASSCGFTNVVPYDRYKGLPNYTPAKGKQPFIVRMYTTQGVITWEALTQAGPVHHVLVPVPGRAWLLQRDALPPAGHQRNLRAAVR